MKQLIVNETPEELAAMHVPADLIATACKVHNSNVCIVANVRRRSNAGFHCVDPSHDRIEFTGADDEELFQNIKAHTAEAHPELTDSQVREMMAGEAWWKEMATSGNNAGSSPSAYDK